MGKERQATHLLLQSVVAALLLTLACFLPRAGSVQAAREEAPPPGVAVLQYPWVLGDVDFLSAKLGFVTLGNMRLSRGYLYRTTDAGRIWRNVMEYPVGGLEPNGHLTTRISFVDSRDGFLFSSAGDWSSETPRQVPIMYRTTNAGLSWREQRLPRVNWIGYYSTDFVTPELGWYLAVSDTDMGQSELALYRTVSGGATWTRQAAYEYGPSGLVGSGGLTLGGSDETLRFFTRSTGWIFGEDLPTGLALDEKSNDGGRHWSACSSSKPSGGVRRSPCHAPLPPVSHARRAKVSSELLRQLAPGCVEKSQLLLPVRTVDLSRSGTSEGSNLIMYRLNAGSRSWQPWLRLRPGLDLRPFSTEADEIRTSTDWFFAGSGRIGYTQDGGSSWTARRGPGSAKDDAYGLDWFGAGTGYVWGGLRVPTAVFDRYTFIGRTADGGRTWNYLRLPESTFLRNP